MNEDRHQPRTAGFTLVELLIVLVVLAIIAALALPMFSGTETTRLRMAANLLLADLEYAQMESISHADAPRVLVVFDDGTGYRIATAATPQTPINDAVSGEPYTTTFGEGRAAQFMGVSLAIADAGDDRAIGFGAMGELDQTTAATLTLQTDHHKIAMTLDPITGRITVGNLEAR